MIVVGHDPHLRALADRIVPVGGDPVESAIAFPAQVIEHNVSAKPSSTAQDPPTRSQHSAGLRDLLHILAPAHRGFLAAVAWGTLVVLQQSHSPRCRVG